MSSRSISASLALLSALYAPAAFAYLDPASGSLFLQMLLGGIAGVALVVRMFWHRILGLFTRKNRDDAES